CLTDGVGLDAVPTVAAVLSDLGLAGGLVDGSAIAIRDPLGATSYELRDGLGRSAIRIDALGHRSSRTYDLVEAGLVATVQTDALGHAVRVVSDAAGRPRQQVDALGYATTAGFDAVGHQVKMRDAMSVGWNAGYDALGRLVSRSNTRTPVGTTIWSYDLDGNRLSETDALGKTETSVYDARNRRIQLTDRLNGITRFAYDLVGNLTQISDADNEPGGGLANLAGTTQYAYDARNLLIGEAFPTGQQGRTLRVYAYDAVRRLSGRTVGILAGAFSATPAFAGAVTTTTYVYDAANRLTTRGYGDGLNDGFGYDAAGRLTSATSARYATTVGRAYDAANRLTSESLSVPDGTLVGTTLAPTTWTVGSAYLDDNSLANQTYPTGSVVTRTYTDRHELATVSLGGSPVSSRVYDASGRLSTATAGNGLVETWSYVAGDYLVAGITVPGVTGFGYTYDAASRKLSETDSIATGQTFGYDHAGRLTAWTAGAATQSWDLTKVGDWSSTTRNGVPEARVNSAVHEATQVGPNILQYDVQGNLTKDEKGTALAWDPENRLTRARVTRDASPSGFGSLASYRYDALGRRIAKTVDGLTTVYLPAGAQTVVELDRPALPPTQAAIDGAEADGTLANLGLAPASGGILPGAGVTRINFQPSTTVTPPGFIRDTGKTADVRTNGLSYGWSADSTAQAIVRGGAVPLVEYDTFVQAQPDAGGSNSWSITLPNGTYPVVVVAGDALSTEQTNHLDIGGVAVTDTTPSTTPGYQAGNFDGYAVEVTVTAGTLTIAPGTGAYRAKLCFVEIGQAGTPGTLITPEITATLAARIAQANAETGANPIARNGVREFVYGSYVDEVLCYQTTVGVVSSRYYPHFNHFYSVAALTDASGAVVERYSYDAYGKRQITAPGGAVRAKSSVGWDRGLTGYILDSETGLLHARARQYSPTLGRFVGRDGLSYLVAMIPGDPVWGQSRPRMDSETVYHSPVTREGILREAARLVRLLAKVDARRERQPTLGAVTSYIDGQNLYGAYFIPNATDATGNACGSGPIGDFMVPDSIGGLDISGCCINHDKCYDTCHRGDFSKKDDCDIKLLLCISRLTRWRYPIGSDGFRAGMNLAQVYYNAVRLQGGPAYYAGQEKACCPKPGTSGGSGSGSGSNP
ncbi:MAG: hypothetical protein HUU35_11230, partial [Armatimonadetes bacterium]|nr:hypothetical protein [Armatimonadota bacterium]